MDDHNTPRVVAGPSSITGALEPIPGLTLGHVLSSVGAEHEPPIGLEKVIVIRHAFKPGEHGHLQGPEDVTEERVLEYTRRQDVSSRHFPAVPPRYWVVLIPDGQRRSRLHSTFENYGEALAERTETTRYFDLHPSNFLAPLKDRLVVDWASPRNWHRRATNAANLPVLEIADRDKVPFPGF